jgi:hypothetical protein
MIYIYRMTRGITNNSRKKNAKIWCPFGPSRTGGCHVARQSLWPPCGRIKDGIRRVMKKRDWLSESRSSKKGFNCGSHLAKIASIDQSSSNVSTISYQTYLQYQNSLPLTSNFLKSHCTEHFALSLFLHYWECPVLPRGEQKFGIQI